MPASASRAGWLAYSSLPSTSKTTTPSLKPSSRALAKGEKTEGMELMDRVSGIVQDTASLGDRFPNGTHEDRTAANWAVHYQDAYGA
jgi:hypothetical protein